MDHCIISYFVAHYFVLIVDIYNKTCGFFLLLFKNNFLTFTCITLHDLAINMAVWWALLRVFYWLQKFNTKWSQKTCNKTALKFPPGLN